MVSSRGALLLPVLCFGLAVGLDPIPARSQGSGSGSETPADRGAETTDDEVTAGTAPALLIAPPMPQVRKRWLRDQLTAAVTARPTLMTARIAYAVTDLANGEELGAFNADTGLNLASNAKLLTSVTALATLGSGFRWRTAVYADPVDDTGKVIGDLYLRGRGDPLLTVGQLEDLADELVARGVHTIDGQLVLDTSYFDGVTLPPHYDEQPKEQAAFRTTVASLGVSRSAATVIVVPGPAGTATVTLEPDAGDYVKITKREVVSVTTGRTRLRVDTKLKAGHVELEVSGQIRAGEGSWDVRRRIDDPARFAGEVFRRALTIRGISVKRRTIGSGTVPLTAKLIAVHDSLPLADVLRFMNKLSDNYVAESVLKTIGAETKGGPGPATWADGVSSVGKYLGTIGLAAGSYRAENGSGLYAATAVSAHQMITLLKTAHADYRIGPDLLASLPIGGVDGTLGKRWHGKPARGRVRAKTGTLDKVTTLVGYIGVESGRPLAFAILVNDVPTGQRAVARAMADDMVDVLAAYLGAQ